MSTPLIVWLLPNWRHSMLAMSLPTLLFSVYAFLIPESPMWLYCNQRESEAKKILDEAALKNGMEPITEKHWAKILEAKLQSERLISDPKVRTKIFE